MDAWELDDLDAARRARGTPYHEFISVPDLSGGLYVLEAGALDRQTPHTEDELYVDPRGVKRGVVHDLRMASLQGLPDEADPAGHRRVTRLRPPGTAVAGGPVRPSVGPSRSG